MCRQVQWGLLDEMYASPECEDWQAAMEGFHRSNRSPSPEEAERMYKQYLNTVAYQSDWRLCFIAVSFALLQAYSSRNNCNSLAYFASLFVGFAPTIYFLRRRKAQYIAWREWFVFYSLLGSMFRYQILLFTVTASGAQPPSAGTQFTLRALLCGPYCPIILTGMSYSLQIQVAFPFTCMTAIGAMSCAYFTHYQLLASEMAQKHLTVLAEKACSIGMYDKFMLAVSGSPVTPENVLINIWALECILGLSVMLFFIAVEETNRRRRFWDVSGIREFPLVWNDSFSHVFMFAIFCVLGVCISYHSSLLSEPCTMRPGG